MSAELHPEVRSALESIRGGIGEFKGQLGEAVKVIDDLRSRVEGIESKTAGLGYRPQIQPGAAMGAFLKSLESKMGTLNENGRLRITTPSFLAEQKAVITSSGLFAPEAASGIADSGKFAYSLADLFTNIPATEGSIFTLRTASESVSPASQTEGSSKAETSFTFTAASKAIPTVAHVCHITRQALQDIPGMGPFLDRVLVWGLRRERERQMLYGTGGSEMDGLALNAENLDSTILNGLSSFHLIDCLGAASVQLAESGYSPDFAVVTPRSWFQMTAAKDALNNYVVGSPLARIRNAAYGLRIVVSDQIVSDSFLVGDSSQSALRTRMEAVVDVSFEHGSNFIENRATLRAEERVDLQTLRPDAYVTGSLSFSPAA